MPTTIMTKKNNLGRCRDLHSGGVNSDQIICTLLRVAIFLNTERMKDGSLGKAKWQERYKRT
jgi:hypothetical protein